MQRYILTSTVLNHSIDYRNAPRRSASVFGWRWNVNLKSRARACPSEMRLSGQSSPCVACARSAVLGSPRLPSATLGRVRQYVGEAGFIHGEHAITNEISLRLGISEIPLIEKVDLNGSCFFEKSCRDVSPVEYTENSYGACNRAKCMLNKSILNTCFLI